MLNRIVEIVFNFVGRFLLRLEEGAQETLFDIDQIFARLTETGEHLIDRIQRMFMLMFAGAALTVLAVTVLTVRIFQLAAGWTIGIGPWNLDGALAFGLLLAAGSGLIGWWLFGRELEVRSPRRSMNRSQTRVREERQAPPTRTPVSPLEEALAVWIRSRVEERQQARATPSHPGEPLRTEGATVWTAERSEAMPASGGEPPAASNAEAANRSSTYH